MHSDSRAISARDRALFTALHWDRTLTHAQLDDFRVVILVVALPTEVDQIASEGLWREVAREDGAARAVRVHVRRAASSVAAISTATLLAKCTENQLELLSLQ